jgi:hypothetical protein
MNLKDLRTSWVLCLALAGCQAKVPNDSVTKQKTLETTADADEIVQYGQVLANIQRFEADRRELERSLLPLGPIACIQRVGEVKPLCGGGTADRGAGDGPGDGPNPRDSSPAERAAEAERQLREREAVQASADRERAKSERDAKVAADKQLTEHMISELEKQGRDNPNTATARAAAIEAFRNQHVICEAGGKCLGDP